MMGIQDIQRLTVLVCLASSLLCTTLAFNSGFYGDNGLQQTERLSVIPSRQKRELKQEILSLLGLHHKPKTFLPVEDSSAPRYMLDLYNTLQEDSSVVEPTGDRYSDDDVMSHVNMTTLHAQAVIKQADMVMSFVNHATKKNGIIRERNKRYYFDFSEIEATEVVIASELRVFKRRAKLRDNMRDPLTLELFRVDRAEELDDRQLVHVTSADVIHEEEDWVSFNVTSAAVHWMLFPANNVGLYLRITDKKGNEFEPHHIGIVGRHGPDDKQPFLVTFFKHEQQIQVRKTRAAQARKRERQHAESSEAMYKDEPYNFAQPSLSFCQRRTLYVNFRDLGWQEWIIAPKGYAAYFCSGQCSFPLNAHMNATNHAIVQTLVHLMNPHKIPLPCCAPTNLSAISVLYFDDGNNVVLKKFNDIVVRACGCH